MLVPALKQVAYDPARYMDVETVDEAVNIILCPTEGMTAKQRWTDEAPALMRIMERYIKRGSAVLDYGCGIGRLAKPLIQKLECRVVGVDISPNMRALAASLVDNPRFFALDPSMFDEFIATDAPFDAAISVWALQHCIDLTETVDRIRCSVRQGGKLIIVNNRTRCLPVENGEWADDGLHVREMIEEAGFKELEWGIPDESIAPGWMQKETFWAVYQKG